ncbi:ABC transporter substrate-binding protein [Nocardioides ginsengisoli]|uniref:ABC transporter substrate-binding protein n=1 Tax=Nocardioides ginsengisoli TaxID=363868 RepID=A0ABW3VZD6_9ACTN
MERQLSRAFKAGALALTGVLALSACGMQAGGDSGKGGAGPLVIGSTNIAETLDPVQAADAHNDFNVAGVYDRLVNYDSDGKMIPQLATTWSFNPSATELTLTLRDDVKFHSGNPFTAADVVYTLDRDKRIGAGVAAFLGDYKSAEAVDAHTVKITLTGTDTTFLGALSPIYIVDSTLVKANEGDDDAQGWIATHDAGSGPFTIKGYSAKQELQLERYADYWDFDEGRPKELVLRMLKDHSASRDELLSGGIDLAMDLSGPDLATVKKDDRFTVQALPIPRETYAWLNTRGGITKDPKVREAIQLAYDYAGHQSSAMGGEGKIATTILPPGIGCAVDAGEPKQDLERAKQLIDEAGVSGRSVSIAYQPTVDEFNVAGTLLQDSLKKIGLQGELQAVTFPQYADRVSKQSSMPDIALAWDFSSYPEAGPQLAREYGSKNAGSTNFTWYANPQVDQWLEEGLAETDTAKACDYFTKVQNQVLADHALLYIADPSINVISDGRVGEIPFSPTQQDFNVGLLRMAK